MLAIYSPMSLLEGVEYIEEDSFILKPVSLLNETNTTLPIDSTGSSTTTVDLSEIIFEPSYTDDNETITLQLEAISGHHPIFLLLIILNVWTTVSNAIVLFVMIRTPALRRRFGCVMLSLSFADLCSSLLVMPLAIYYFSNSAGWLLGSYLCVWWVTADVFLCTASICHHASIAIHRYLAIAKPHQMSMITTNTPIIVQLILPSWAIGFAIAMILAIQALLREDIVFREDTCGLQDRLYLIYSSVVSFFIPLSVIILVSLKSILLLRNHLKIKQQAIMKNLPRPKLESASCKPLAHQSPISTNSLEVTDGCYLKTQYQTTPETISNNSPVKSPSPLKGNNENDTENKKMISNNSNINTFIGRSKRAMSLAPSTGKLLLSKQLKAAAHHQTPADPISKMTSLKSLIESYLELGSYVYGTVPGTSTTISSGLSQKIEVNQSSQSLTSSIENLVRSTGGDSSPQLRCENDINSAGRMIQCARKTPTSLMEAIKEEEHYQHFSPAGEAGKLIPQDTLTRNLSFVSCGSDVFIGDEQSLSVDLNLPINDFESAVISVDEITPSMDMMTSFGFVIPEIPSPVDEEHPLDLRIVFSRTVPNFKETARFNSREKVANKETPAKNAQQQEKTPLGLTESSISMKMKSGFRKRAYTVSFPISNVLVQQAPLAKMELLSSPQQDRRHSQVTETSSSALVPRKESSETLVSRKIVNESGRSHRSRLRVSQNSLLTTAAFSPGMTPRGGRRMSRRRCRATVRVKRNSSLGTSQASLATVRVRSKSPVSTNSSRHRRSTVTNTPKTAESSGTQKTAGNGGSEEEKLEVDIISHTQPYTLTSPAKNDDEPEETPPEIVTEECQSPTQSEFVLLPPEIPDSRVSEFAAERLSKIEVITPTRSSPRVNKSTSLRLNSEASTFPRLPSPRLVHVNNSSVERKLTMAVGEKKIETKHEKSARQKQREKEKQAERVLLFVLFIFVCLWLPFFTTNFLYGICPRCVYEDVFIAFTWCGWCSSAINPIVYTFFNRDFKRAFIRLFWRRCKGQSIISKGVASLPLGVVARQKTYLIGDQQQRKHQQ